MTAETARVTVRAIGYEGGLFILDEPVPLARLRGILIGYAVAKGLYDPATERIKLPEVPA